MKLTIEIAPDEIPVCRHCGEPVVTILIGSVLDVKHASGLFACCLDCPTVAEVWMPGTCRECLEATEADPRDEEWAVALCGGCKFEHDSLAVAQ